MNGHDKKWYMHYEQLVEFKRINGHCRVPFKHEQNKSLGRWVSDQRTYYKTNKLRLDRKEVLDRIGFAWRANTLPAPSSPMNVRSLVIGSFHALGRYKPWREQYEKLVKFKRINGHCRVPFKYEQDKSLGRWVSDQRTNYKANKLRLDRKELLDRIGFAWRANTLATPSSVTSSALIGSDPDEEVVKKEATTESGQMAATSSTNQRGGATGSCSSVEEDGCGRDEEDSKPSLVTSSALIGSYSDQEVVQEEATTPDEIPSGWARVKLEPDC